MKISWIVIAEGIIYIFISLLSVYFAVNLIRGLERDNVYMHEKAHQEIFKTYGCNSTIEISADGLSGNTSYSNCTFDNDNVWLLQEQNEIFQYNLQGISSTLYWMLFTQIVFCALVIALLIRNQRIVIIY